MQIYRTCILFNNGNATCFGQNEYGESTIPIGFNTNVKNI